VNNTRFSNILKQLNDLYSAESPFEGNIFYEHHQNLIVNATLDIESNDKRNKYQELAKYAQNILEIGFNAGHSALLLLESNPHVNYTGIDINTHEYTNKAVKIMKDNYPNRFRFISGDSTQILQSKIGFFDLIIIDGDHSISGLYSDFVSSLNQTARGKTIIIFDDTNIPHINNFVHKLIKLKLIKPLKFSSLDKNYYASSTYLFSKLIRLIIKNKLFNDRFFKYVFKNSNGHQN
jgi:predicted O-methyltransferase YrrM